MCTATIGHQGSLQHLLAELERIDLKLRSRVLQLRSQYNRSADQEFRGVYISEEDMDDILTTPACFRKTTSRSNDAASEPLEENLRQVELEIKKIKAGGLQQGVTLRLEQLRQMFCLTPFELDALLICLVPEVDLRYEKLYAYLQDDVTKKRPTIGLVLDILCSSFHEKLAARSCFDPQGPLTKHRLLRLPDDSLASMASQLARPLKVDDRIVAYLLGSDELDVNLLPFVQVVLPRIEFEKLVLDEDVKSRLVGLTADYMNAGSGLIWHFHGPLGAGKQSSAEALCHQLGLKLLTIDCSQMPEANHSSGLLAKLIFRESRLQNAAIYWDNFDIPATNDFQRLFDIIAGEFESCPCLVFLSGNNAWYPLDVRCSLLQVAFPMPDFAQRKRIWQGRLDGQSSVSDAGLAELAGKFRLTAGQIRSAAATAQSVGLWRDPESRTIHKEDLYAACRQQSNHKLNQLASKITPRYVWADIVLPKDQLNQLREVCSYVKYHHVVYEEWGFEHKLSLGKGLNVLFAGPSGTGKTMAAEIMANELGLDLYRIDLATVVSKYIGETEKNLDRIFKEAQDSNSILFFDEADAIFGKRSEVRDSHDRYANIEIAYLLQKMEEYQGIVILATNLRKNLDEAFVRRMHFGVEFPSPEEADRYRIWQKAFPEAAPLSQDIDLAFMARRFKITGGNIKNIALSAAFLGAEHSGMVTMEHLIRATKREYQKMGKLCTEADFGRYFELVRG
jgi:ATP-dependent 26S proteasome regulatory subunit